MRVKVAQLGQETRELEFDEVSVPVETVLREADIKLREDEKTKEKDVVLLNGEEVTPDTPMVDGAVLTVVPKVKGG